MKHFYKFETEAEYISQKPLLPLNHVVSVNDVIYINGNASTSSSEGEAKIKEIIGNLDNLETKNKSSLIAAINELVQRFNVLEQSRGGVNAAYDESNTIINFTNGAVYNEPEKTLTLNGGSYDEETKTIKL